jgi:hypothetical protein
VTAGAREELALEIDPRTGARAMSECPRYSSCSAPLCPLDHEWHRRSFVKADSICHWQREALAPAAEQSFAALEIVDIWRRIQFTDTAMRKKHPDLSDRLDKAAEYRNDPEAKERLKAAFARAKKGATARDTGGIQAGSAQGHGKTSRPIGQ